jgi:hypothetical protein
VALACDLPDELHALIANGAAGGENLYLCHLLHLPPAVSHRKVHLPLDWKVNRLQWAHEDR